MTALLAPYLSLVEIALKRSLLLTLEGEAEVIKQRINVMHTQRARGWSDPLPAVYDDAIAKAEGELGIVIAKVYEVEDWLIDHDADFLS